MVIIKEKSIYILKCTHFIENSLHKHIWNAALDKKHMQGLILLLLMLE